MPQVRSGSLRSRLLSSFQVIWACHEYACTAVDFLARRCRMSFLNVSASEEALPKVIDIMAKELNWSTQRKKQELEDATVRMTTL